LFPSHDHDGLEVGKTYNIRIRHISTFNTYSAYATVNASTGGTAYTALEDGATVGAKAGTNLKDSSNNTLGDSDIITNQGTAQNITNQGNLATLDTVNTAQLVDDAITNAKIAVNAIQGDVLAAGAITENKLATNAVTADKISANSITSAKIAANAITAAKIAAGTITATEIASGTITASQINVSTLAVEKFDDVTAQIINHNGNNVPLTRFASDYKTTGNSGGSGVSTHVPVDVTNCRSGGSFVAYIQGILGNVQNMQVEFSVDGGSTYNVAANGPVFTISAGTFRPHTFFQPRS